MNDKHFNLEQLIMIRANYASVNDFALHNRIPNPMVYKWVRGEVAPSVRWIVKLAEILETEPHDILYAVIETQKLATPRVNPLEKAIRSKKK